MLFRWAKNMKNTMIIISRESQHTEMFIVDKERNNNVKHKVRIYIRLSQM